MKRASPRNVTRVAVGVLLRADGSVLLADRPAGKPYAGYWEFPGGKIETGEPVDRALERELHEELGITVGMSTPWVTFEFDYPHAYVELQFRLVCQWSGSPHAREGQRLAFVDPWGGPPAPLLPAAAPALRWLRLPQRVVLVEPSDLPSCSTQLLFGRQAPQTGRAMAVVEADWRSGGELLSKSSLMPGSCGDRLLWLAAGPGAGLVEGSDGVVVDVRDAVALQRSAERWAGAWVSSAKDVVEAVSRGFDFLLVQSPTLAEQLRVLPAALPAYLPARADGEGQVHAAPRDLCGERSWHDLRSTTALASKVRN